MPLTPDDYSPDSLPLKERPDTKSAPTPPTIISAVLAGMLVLFLLRGITLASTTAATSLIIIGSAIFVGLLVYLLLFFFQITLPLSFLSIMSAELGMLYSIPADSAYFALFSPGAPQILALGWLLLTGFAGLALAFALQIEKRPNQVLLVILLAAFVASSFVTMSR